MIAISAERSGELCLTGSNDSMDRSVHLVGCQSTIGCQKAAGDNIRLVIGRNLLTTVLTAEGDFVQQWPGTAANNSDQLSPRDVFREHEIEVPGNHGEAWQRCEAACRLEQCFQNRNPQLGHGSAILQLTGIQQ